MIYTLIAILILIIAAYLALFKPLYFIILYGLTGCRYDSRGVTEFLSNQLILLY